MPRERNFVEDEVLEKAMYLFWKQGYNATSIQDIVEHLGINRASLYNTFGDKHELFKKSFDHYRNKNVAVLKNFLGEYSDVKSGLKALFHQAVIQSAADKNQMGCFVVNTATEMIPGDEEIQKILKNNKETVERVFLEYLEKGKAENQFSEPRNLKAYASLLFTLYNGLKVVSKIDPAGEEQSAAIDSVLSLIRQTDQ